MRCIECNEALEDHEAVRKSKQTGEFLDVCDACLGEEFLLMEEALSMGEKVKATVEEK